VVVDTSPGRSLSPPFPEPDPVTQVYYGEKNREPEAAVVDRMKADDATEAVGLFRPATGLGLIVLLLLALYSVKAWRRLAPRWAALAALDRVGYRAALDLLAEVGLVRRFGETRAEFAERVSGLVPEFIALTESHDRRTLTGEVTLDRAGCLDLIGRVSARLAAGFPRLRLLGLVDPVSWKRAR
jgi:hypothetical protein